MGKDWDDKESNLDNPFKFLEKMTAGLVSDFKNQPIRHKIIMDLTVDELYSVMEFMAKNNIGTTMFSSKHKEDL